MLAVTLTFSAIISVLFLLVGGVVGYLKEYAIDRTSQYIPMHPEMFDENGQIIPDDVLAVRFENTMEDLTEDGD